MSYLKQAVQGVNISFTSQTMKAAAEQVRNDAGGYSFPVDQWTQLHRWLVMGSEGGSYYVDQKAATFHNIKVLDVCLAENGERVVNQIRAIADMGRALRKDQYLFAFAKASLADEKARILV